MTHRPSFAASSVVSLTLAATLLVPGGAGAQDVPQEFKNFMAYLALSVTPVGALPPLVTRSMAGGPAAISGSSGATGGALRPQIAFRYGRVSLATDSPGDYADINAFAATGLIAAGEAATLSATAGLLDPTCRDCESEWMFGVAGDVALGGTQLGTQAGSPRLTYGLSGELGYANIEDTKPLSLTAGVPIALVAQSGTMRFVPYLVPAVGYGRTRFDAGDPTYGAFRFLLGGGVSLLNVANALSVNAGFQKVFFSFDTGFGKITSKTLFGASITIGN